MKNFNVILFNDFETLDVFGPVEVIGKLPSIYKINYYSIDGSIITNSQNCRIITDNIDSIDMNGIILIPGGMGTRKLVDDDDFIDMIKLLSAQSEYVLTVCTGSALLARTGLLNNRNATSNTMAFDWVCQQNDKVNWIRNKRWIIDDKYYTSAGVSAGIDMTLQFIADIHSYETAKKITEYIEYDWK